MALSFYHGHGSPYSWRVFLALEYLDDRFAKDGGPRLYGGNPRVRARTRLIVREIEEYLTAGGIDAITGELFFNHGREPDLAKVAQGREVVAEELAGLARRLDSDFFGGAAPSAADLVLYPAYGYLKRITFRKPETRLTEVVPEKLAQWGARIEALPFLDKTIPAHWR